MEIALLDADILSAMRRKQRDPNLENWLRGLQSADVFELTRVKLINPASNLRRDCLYSNG